MLTLESRAVRWRVEPRGAARGVTERAATILIARDTHLGLGEWGRCRFCLLAPSEAPANPRDLNSFAGDAVAFVNLRPTDTAIENASAALDFAATIPEPALRFALESALLSLIAQRERTSVAALLVAHPLAQIAVAPVVDDPAEAVAAVAAGATTIKLKVGPHELARAFAISRAVPHTQLRIDANRRWPRGDVRAMFAALRELPVSYVEEPCDRAHELLVEPLSIPIALDESLAELDDAAIGRACASPGLAALVLKPALLGGFARCLTLAALARRHGKHAIASHTLEGPVGTAACIELARAIGGDAPAGLAPHPALDHFAEAL